MARGGRGSMSSVSKIKPICPMKMEGCDGGGRCSHGEGFKGTLLRLSSTARTPVDYVPVEEADKKVIQDLYDLVSRRRQHSDNYLALFGFILLTILYFTILYMQANSFKTYEVSTAHYTILPNGLTGEGGFVFPTTNDIYSWINDSIIQSIWTDPVCGNSICERPQEYAAFGRFGCQSDCGNSPNLTKVTIAFTTSFSDGDELAASSWNLCLQSPTMFCWFEERNNFTNLRGNDVIVLNIPDGDWIVDLDAPYGKISGAVTYNGSYAWKTASAIQNGSVIVKWDACAPDPSSSPSGICREIAANLSTCIVGCYVNDAYVANDAASISNLFVDFIGFCVNDPLSLETFEGLDCSGLKEQIAVNSSGDFQYISCQGAPSGRRLLGAQESPKSVQESRRISLEELNSQPFDYTSTCWNPLGATNSQRLYNLQVATQRALYTWASDSCLANRPMNISGTDRLSAFFCTLFGGPFYSNGCQYVNSSGSFLQSDKELAREMRTIHSRLNISREQQEKFVSVLILALQSVTLLDSSTVIALETRLRQLDTEIVSSSTFGCPYVAQTVDWAVGATPSIKATVGDIITFSWEDDQPHSVLVDDGLGDGPLGLFQGMGANRLIVSRSSLCTTQNVGRFGLYSDPVPCVLADRNATGGSSFKYSLQLTTEGNFSFVDGRFPDSTHGTIEVSATSATGTGDNDSLSYQCSPGCTLGSIRDGACLPACNNLDCAFDGGDCACSPDSQGDPSCVCPPGQTRGTDGSCCEATSVGVGLKFPFSVMTWGPNVSETDAEFLPRTPTPLFRFVAPNDRILVGMVMEQKRWGAEECRDKKFASLYPSCTAGASTAPFGVNPVFLRSSALYNAVFAKNDTLYYANYSSSFDNSTIRNKQGTPFGFTSRSQESFHYIFDMNFNNAEATASLQYLADGFFLDNSTKTLSVKIVTYNGVENYFTLSEVLLSFQTGGKIVADYNIQSIKAEQYRSNVDKIRFALEILFVIAMCWNLIEEFRELYKTVRRTGSAWEHLKQLWNIIDLISIGIMIAAVVLWVRFVLTSLQVFSINLRYDVYDLSSLSSPGQYWKIVEPGTGFEEALKAYSRLTAMVDFRTSYMALNGLNVELMVLRILKLMDFQPRMGTITRTIASAAPELLHFFIVFSVTFIGFALYGVVAFGSRIEAFRSLPVSLSTCFEAIIGNDDVNGYLVQLTGWQLISAVIFWWSFIMVVVFIIFNLLIAIIVDGFLKVRSTYNEAPSMPEEVLWLLSDRIRRLFMPLKTDRQIQTRLIKLGALKYKPNQMKDDFGEVPATNQVLQLKGKQLDEETVTAIFERSARKNIGVARRVKPTVSPDKVARVLFQQYSKQAEVESEVMSNEEVVAKAMEDLKEAKGQVDNMKLLLHSLQTEVRSLSLA